MARSAASCTSKTPTIGAGQLQGTDAVDGLAQAFASKLALGTGNSTLQVSAYTVHDGNNGGNYNVHPHTATGTITPKALTVTGITANNKVWDGSTSATLTLAGATLVGVIAHDGVTLDSSGAAGAFSSNAVGAWPVAVSGLALKGTDARNYSVTQPTTSASISAWSAQGKGFYSPVGTANSVFTRPKARTRSSQPPARRPFGTRSRAARPSR